MANKLKVYQFEDTATGEVIKFEGPEDASDAEINSYLESQYATQEPVIPQQPTTPTGTVSFGPSESVVPTSAAPVIAKQDTQDVAVMGADTWGQAAPAQPLADENAQRLLEMVRDPSIPVEDLQKFLGPLGHAVIPSQVDEYRKALAAGQPVSNTIGFRSIASQILEGQQVNPNENLNDVTASLAEGAVGNPMGIIGRLTQDLFDSTLDLNRAPGMIESGGINKDTIRQQYPYLDETAIEAIHDNLIGAVRQRQVAAARQEVERRDVNPVVRFAGNMAGSISPVDLIPLGRGGTLGARLAEGAYSNALADAALQANDVAYGAQGEYNYGQTLQAGLEGLVFQGGMEGLVKGAGKLYSAVRGNTPAAPQAAPAEGPAITAPVSRRTAKKYAQQMADTIDQTVSFVDQTVSQWTNRPNVEVHQNFGDLQGVDNDALGVYDAANGGVALNMERILYMAKKHKVDPDAVVKATLFHESLGHYGLAQRFGDDLDLELGKFYESGEAGFKAKVDAWMAARPDEYADDPYRHIRATEEVLAKMSESGPLPAKFVDRLVTKLKGYARDMGLYDFQFSEREIRTILSQAHAAVVAGKGSDVAGNGFRLMMAGRKSLTAPHQGLKEAQLMSIRGKDVGPTGESRDSTGWFKGPDDGWRYEIDDSQVGFKSPDFNRISEDTDIADWMVESDSTGSLFEDLAKPEWRDKYGESAKLSGVLDHPELFAAYPELGDINVTRNKPLFDYGKTIQGGFNPATNTLNVTPYAVDPKGTMLHEIQHAIQDIEGFASGGNKDTAIAKMPAALLSEATNNFIQWTKRNLENALIQHRAFSDSFYNNPLIKTWREASIEAAAATKYRMDLRKELSKDNPDYLVDPTYREIMRADDEAKVLVIDARAAFLESMGYPGAKWLSDLPKSIQKELYQLENFLINPKKSDADIVKSLAESELRIMADQARINKLEKARDAGNTKYLREFFRADKDASFQAYENLFGEVEARDTAERKDLTAEERAATEPYSSQSNIDPSQYIIDQGGPNPLSEVRYSKEYTPPSEGSNDLFKDTPEELIRKLTPDYVPESRSWTEAKRDYTSRGLSLKQANKTKHVGDLDRRIFAFDRVWQDALSKLEALHAKMETPNWSLADATKYRQLIFETNALSSKILGENSEYGRALNAIKATQMSMKNMRALQEMLNADPSNPLNGFTDQESMLRFAKQIQDALAQGNVNGAINKVRQTVKPYWWQYVLTARHNAMLSGLGTHAKNAYDGLAMLFRNLEENVMGAGLNLVTPSKMWGKGDDRASFKQSLGHAYGLMRAVLDGDTYLKAGKILKEGLGDQGINKYDVSQARIPVLSKVTDALAASDSLFTSVNDSANLYTLGIRSAEADGFTGIRALEEGSVRAQNPTTDMLKRMGDLTDETLMRDAPSWWASVIEPWKVIKPNMTAGQQAGAAFANIIFPFLRVTDRLLMSTIRRSPLAILDKNTRADFAAGGARAQIAAARILYGTAMLVYYWNRVGEEEGQVTGEAPLDYKKTQALEAGGYRPNSVVKDGQYVDATATNFNINPLDEQNNIAASIATLREAYDKGEDVSDSLGIAFFGLMRLFASQSYGENVANYLAPLTARSESEQEGAWANIAANQLSSFVPAGVRQANQQIFDPIKRDATGDKSFGDRVVGRVMSGIPGLSTQLPEKYDLYGDLMPQGRSTSGMNNVTAIKQDDVSQEIQRLERTTDKPVVTAAPSSFEINFDDYGITAENINPDAVSKAEDGKITLTAAGKQEWQRVQGYYLRTWMQEELSAPGWKTLTDAERIAIVKDVKKEAYDAAKEYMLPIIYTPQEEGL